MNNLKALRTMANVSPKILSKLLNTTVYTYLAYEQEKMMIPPELVKMISILYDIKEELIIDTAFQIDISSVQQLTMLSTMSEEEKYRVLSYRLLKNHCMPTYRDIKKIKDSIKESLNN